METGTGVGKGEEEQVTLADVLRLCDIILELLRPFQPCNVMSDVLVASDGGTSGVGDPVAWAMTSSPLMLGRAPSLDTSNGSNF
jgi:hypothetical protein